MTILDLDPRTPLSPAVVDRIGDRIDRFLTAQRTGVERIAAWLPEGAAPTDGSDTDAGLATVRELASAMTAGGKRLRPAFALWGCVAAGGPVAVTDAVWTAAAALDLLHVSALVHDDVMDDSDVRRGRPAAHKQFEQLHADRGWSGDREQFGRAGAILLGDLLVMWSVEMVDTAGLDPTALVRALPMLHAMRTEVTLGQFLDVMAQCERVTGGGGDPASAVVRAERVVEHKSAKYTVQRPLLFGARLAGADDRLTDALAVYGSAIGRAFQYRDDLLGVFGDEELTGKPAGDDLREGKRTLLVAHTRERLGTAERDRFDALFGRADLDAAGRDELRALIRASGAEADVETMITALHADAVAALDPAPVTEEGRTALQVLADVATRREF